MNGLGLWIRKRIFGMDVRSNLEMAIDRGMKVGKNLSVQDGCSFDVSHSWLIEIGDNVTIAPRVMLLAHDASTKRTLGYTVIGRITIGSNVFIGGGSIVLPNVTIGDNVIVGAGSVVTRNIPAGSVAVGNPARVICSYDAYVTKRKAQFESGPLFDISYTLNGGIDEEKKEEMKAALTDGIGGVV